MLKRKTLSSTRRPRGNLCRPVEMRTGRSASEVGAACAVVYEVTGVARNSRPKLDCEEGRSSALGFDEAERMPSRVKIVPERRRI